MGLGCAEQPVPTALLDRTLHAFGPFSWGLNMRVAIFFDGKNFYSGWRANAGRFRIESFSRLAEWLVEQAKGTYLAGAYYYTGIETGAPEASETDGQRRLVAFLDMLETQPGFFVFRFPRKVRQHHCQACGAITKFTTEKEVDTTLVADMLRLAAVNAFDVAVVVSGDADLAPAVEGVRGLGKQVYVATWGGSGLAPRVRRAAFDHLDLLQGLGSFASQHVRSAEVPVESVEEDVERVFLAELLVAQERFIGGYVGVNYFMTKWQSQRLSDNPAVRQRVLNRLVESNLVEVYFAPSGDRAMRLTPLADDADATLPTETPVGIAIEEASAALINDAPVLEGPLSEVKTVAAASSSADADSEGCFRALRDAERYFRDRFVGYSYFLTKWRTTHMTDDPVERETLLGTLIAQRRAELYDAGGTRAVRTLSHPPSLTD